MKNKNNKVSTAAMSLTDAQRQLIIDNIPFAEHIGIFFAGLGRIKGLTVAELQADACFGLCEAALRFNPDCGTDFKTYAYNWCRKYILKDINNQNYNEEYNIERLEDDIIDEGAEIRKAQANKVQEMLRLLNVMERNVVCLIYGLAYSDLAENSEPKDFREIASLMHLRPQRIHQIYDNAMAKLEMKA